MVIEISDKFIKQAGISKEEILLTIALEFFKEEKITQGQASQLAMIHQIQFQKELAKRKIPIHYGLDEFKEDLKTLSNLKRL